MTSVLPSPARKLPIWSTVAACYTIMLANLDELLRIAWFLLLIMVPLYFAAHWLAWSWTVEGQPIEGLAGSFFAALPNLIELPFLASIAVAWHRLLLRQEKFEGARYFRFDRIVWRYAGLSLALLVVCTGPIYVLPSPSSGRGPELVSFFGLFVFAMAMIVFALPRLSLALPAIALDEEVTLAQVWRATRGNTWRLAFAMLLCVLPVLLFIVPISLVGDSTSRASSVLLRTADSLLNAILVTLGVTLLTLAYRILVRAEVNGATARG